MREAKLGRHHYVRPAAEGNNSRKVKREGRTAGTRVTVHSHQQVAVWDGEQELDESLQGVVEGIVPVEAEDTKVDVAAAQGGF